MSIDLKAHGLRVKRIKWDAFGNLYVGYPGVDYKIRLSDEKFVVIANIDWHGKEEPRTGFELSYGTIDEAKAACQAHHESQVLALLESIEGGR